MSIKDLPPKSEEEKPSTIKIKDKKRASCCGGLGLLFLLLFVIGIASGNVNTGSTTKKIAPAVKTATSNKDSLLVSEAIKKASQLQCDQRMITTKNNTYYINYTDWGKTFPLVYSLSINNYGTLELSYNSDCMDKPTLGASQQSYDSTYIINLQILESEAAILVSELKNTKLSKTFSSIVLTANAPTYDKTCNDNNISLAPIYTLSVTQTQFQYFNYTQTLFTDERQTLFDTLKKEGVTESVSPNYTSCSTASYINTMRNALDDITSGASDSSVATNDYLQGNATEAKAQFHEALAFYQGASTYLYGIDTPSGANNLTNDTENCIKLFSDAVNLTEQGVDSNNVSFVNQANDDISQAETLLQKAKQELSTYSSSLSTGQ